MKNILKGVWSVLKTAAKPNKGSIKIGLMFGVGLVGAAASLVAMSGAALTPLIPGYIFATIAITALGSMIGRIVEEQAKEERVQKQTLDESYKKELINEMNDRKEHVSKIEKPLKIKNFEKNDDLSLSK